MSANPSDLPSHSSLLSLVPDVKESEWPILGSDAMYGLAGEIVRSIEPHTEADPVALLVTILTTFGAAVGRGPHAIADGAEHPGRLYAVIVGDTARARKGTSWQQCRRIFVAADSEFIEGRVLSGFGSGESFVDAVAEGDDGRVLVIEPEWARLLVVGRREGSTLSPLLRQAWDGDRLMLRSRASGAVSAEGGHVAVLGHVTAEELRRKLTDTEIANGFANRHLFALASRSKLLPNGGNLDPATIEKLGAQVGNAVATAQGIELLTRTSAAETAWASLYSEMAHDEPGGLLGAIIARDQAQVLRLSVIYALLDGTRRIDVLHVRAAYAVWRYCRESARIIFGDSLGNPIADKLLAAIRRAGPSGLTATEQSQALGRHATKQQIHSARRELEQGGRAVSWAERTKGAPVTISVAVEYAKLANKAKQDSADEAPDLTDDEIESYAESEDFGDGGYPGDG